MIPNIIAAGWKWIERETDLLWPASLEIVFAATLLLVIALVMHLALGRVAASLRHRVWALTMGALLLLPLLCPILPKLPLPLNIPLAASSAATSGPAALTPERPSGAAIALPPAKKWTDSEVHPTPSALPVDSSPTAASPLPQPSSALPAEIPATAPATKPSIESGRSLLATCNCALILVWAVGTVLYLLAMARWLWLERRLAKNASEVADPSWQALLEELKLQFGIRWAVTLGVSQESEVPLAVGWRRPKILLPVDCRCWAAEKRRVVLAHELSHVARHDVFWQVVARLACAVYWFHPLAWLAERRMRLERELACDDAVLRSGSRPDQYAAVLLDVAAAVSRRPRARAAAVAMACRHPVQRRIRAILEPGLNRLPVGRRAGRLLLAAALVLAVLAAGLHPFAPPQVKADPPKLAIDAAAKSEQHVVTPNEASKPPAVAASAKVAGKVIDENAKPLAGADVWLPVSLYGIGEVETLHTKSDAQGRFAVEISAALRAKIQWWDWVTTVCWGYAAGHQVGTARAEKPSGASEVVIRLEPETDTDTLFIVLDPQRQPCAGALVEPYGIRAPENIHNLPDELVARVASRTDAEGRVRLPAVSRETLYNVRITTKDFGIQVQRMEKSKPPAIAGSTIHLRPVGKIEGRLIADPPETAGNVGLFFSTEDRGTKPTEGDAVFRKEWLALHPEHRSIPWPTEGKAEVKSDKEGRFVVPTLAEGDMEVYVNVNENQPLRPKLPEHVRLGSGATTLLDIPLVPTVLVRGSVRENETAKPLPGALVCISYGVGRQGASAVTDAQGNYTVRVLPGRVRFQLTAAPRGYVQVGEHWNGDSDVPNDEIEVPKDAKQFDLPPAELAPAKDIDGRLVDEHDQPVSNARVVVIAEHRHYGYGESNSDGKFSLGEVPTTINLGKAEYECYTSNDGSWHKCKVLKADPLILRALPNDTRAIDIAAGRTLAVDLGKPDDKSKPPAEAPSASVTFRSAKEANAGAPLSRSESRLSADATVAGKVIDENGKPLAGADVWLPVWLNGIGTVETLHAKSDAQGRFVVEIGAALLAKFQPWDRWITVWAYSSGRQANAERAVLPSGASDVVLRLGPAADTSFVVLDPQGRPCEGALVEPSLFKTSLAFQLLPDELLARVAARTDAEGRAKLPAISPDALFEIRVTTKTFGIQVQRVEKSKPPAIVGRTVRLRSVAKIEGRITADRPDAARDVRLEFTTEDFGGPYYSPQKPRASPTEGHADVKSDKDGRFVVPALAEGSLRINAIVHENQPLRPKLRDDYGRLEAGSSPLMEIPMVSTVGVRGAVRAKDTGKPIPSALVHIYYGAGRQGADALTDAQGNYAARVLPGHVGLQICSDVKGYVQLGAPWNRPMDVLPGVKGFDLPPVELVPAKDVDGRLVDEHDRPVSNVDVCVVDEDRSYGYGKSDSSGKFSLTGVPTTIDPSKAEYQWSAPDDGVPHKCEVLKTNPLLLRALPRDPLMDMP